MNLMQNFCKNKTYVHVKYGWLLFRHFGWIENEMKMDISGESLVSSENRRGSLSQYVFKTTYWFGTILEHKKHIYFDACQNMDIAATAALLQKNKINIATSKPKFPINTRKKEKEIISKKYPDVWQNILSNFN